MRRVDEEMDFKCYVCGVDGEAEEMSDEEDVVKVDRQDQEGAVVEKI